MPQIEGIRASPAAENTNLIWKRLSFLMGRCATSMLLSFHVHGQLSAIKGQVKIFKYEHYILSGEIAKAVSFHPLLESECVVGFMFFSKM